MGDKETNKLLKDAIFIHLLNEGYSEYAAKIEAERRFSKIRLIKENKLWKKRFIYKIKTW